MTEDHDPAGRGPARAPTEELCAEISSFASEIKAFKAGIETRLTQKEERLIMPQTKSAPVFAARPALAHAAPAEAPHQKAFNAYLRSGDDDGLRGLDMEGKAMSSAVAADGGYLVNPEVSDTIRARLVGAASLRQIASVVAVEASSFDVLVDRAEADAGWADEATATTETGSPQIDRISIPLHELSALPKASQRLLDDAAFDIETWLAGRIADKFARTEATAFVAGDGIAKPRGFLTHPTVDNASWSWGQIGTVKTGTDGDFGPLGPDALIDLVYALDAGYRTGASFVMNSKTAGAVRKLKDNDGRFLWSDSLASGEPARLLGYPVLIAEDMPDIATGANAIAFGDFSKGYTIAERPDLRVLRDPFSAKPHVLFYATKRVGGDVTDFAAIKLLTFAA